MKISQSDHFGIETLQRTYISVDINPHNQTILELKLMSHFLHYPSNRSHNQTILELKLKQLIKTIRLNESHNQTILELKLEIGAQNYDEYNSQSDHFGIETNYKFGKSIF